MFYVSKVEKFESHALAMNDSVASRAGPTLADLILKFG
jgi:hypothetical protein